MRSGKLDRTIEIQRETETVSPSGAVTRSWSTLATVRAEIVTASATEFLTGSIEGEHGNIIFRVRYVDGITTADRVTYAGTTYNLKEVVEIGRRRGLELRGVSTT